MPFPNMMLHLLAAEIAILANSQPLDWLFDDFSNDDLNIGTDSPGLIWPPPFAGSSVIASSDEDLPTDPALSPFWEDGNDDTLLLSSLPSCNFKRSLSGENGDDGGLRARDGSSSSPSCAAELNLPLDAFSNPEEYLRDNIILNSPLSPKNVAPDEYFEPFLLPDESENEAAKVGGKSDRDPCAFPYLWHLCCDYEFGYRPSVYFPAEMVIDCMDGCHLSTSHAQYISVEASAMKF